MHNQISVTNQNGQNYRDTTQYQRNFADARYEIITDSDYTQGSYNRKPKIKNYLFSTLKSKLDNILKTQKYLTKLNKFKDEPLLGIDITPSCIYVCQVDNNSGRNALTGMASVCVESKFVGEDILTNPNLYSEKLRKLIKENKITTKKVAVSLPVSSSIVKLATISKMQDVDIATAVRYGSLWQSLMNTEDSPDNYSIFYQVIRREEHSETMDILIVATKLEDIKLYKDIVTKSGLKPVIIDAKAIAINYAIKKRPVVDQKFGTMLIEFGLENNYIMVMAENKPRVFNIDVTDRERVALLGKNPAFDNEIIDDLIIKFNKRIKTISDAYLRLKPQIEINEIYVISSTPITRDFVEKLNRNIEDATVREFSMFDYLIIDDNFTVSKDCALNTISSWSGAIAMALSPWHKKKQDWIEIKKSAATGTLYYHHDSNIGKTPLPQIAVRVGSLDYYYNSKQLTHVNNNVKQVKSVLMLAIAVAFFCLNFVYKIHQKITLDYNATLTAERELGFVKAEYQEKYMQIAALKKIDNQFSYIEVFAENVKNSGNQQYVLSLYNYLDNVLQEGVWLKQLSYVAPDIVEIEGKSVSDTGVVKLLATLSDSKMFDKMALKHMESAKEFDLYEQNYTLVKSFVFSGHMADTLPGDYLNKPNLVAGSLNHGG